MRDREICQQEMKEFPGIPGDYMLTPYKKSLTHSLFNEKNSDESE